MQKILASKLAIIGLIIGLLIIPLMLISGKISERNSYQVQAKNSVAKSWAGHQKIMGPILVIPYTEEAKQAVWSEKNRQSVVRSQAVEKRAFILPESIHIDSSIDTDTRYKGIYKIPVYTSLLKIKGEFSKAVIEQTISRIRNSGKPISLGTPFLSTIISDPRGITSTPKLNWAKEKLLFKPGSQLPNQHNGIHALLSILPQPSADPLHFDFQIELRGTEQISFIPAGQETEIQITSAWPHPEFTGSFLPSSREIDSNGYQAHWKITSFASNIETKAKQCAQGNCEALFSTHLGVKHIHPVDVYLQSERSVKYGFLFIILSFITFFIFEVTQKLSIHPIQYFLMGLAIAVFYLLLVSLSEHINFMAAYSIAAVFCVSLLFYYLRFILDELKQASIFSASFLLLYIALYIIISAEDFAFMMGGLLTFLALATTMITTRNINWYQTGGQFDDEKTPPA